MKKFLFTIMFGVFSAGLFGSSSAQALGVSPARNIVTIDPGKTAEVVVRVTNDEKGILNLEAGVTGVRQDSAGHPQFGLGLDEAEKWITSPAGIINVQPDQVKDVRFQLRVPSGVAPGSHWVGLTITAVGTSGGAGLQKEVVSLLAVQVAGEVREALVGEGGLSRHVLLEPFGTTLALALTNEGSIEVPLAGMLTVRNLSAAPVVSVPFVFGNEILPGAKRLLERRFVPNQLNIGCTGDLVICPKLLWPGLYTVSVEAVYGRTQQKVIVQDSFWFFPIWSMIAGLLVVIAISLFVRRSIRTRRMKHYAP